MCSRTGFKTLAQDPPSPTCCAHSWALLVRKGSGWHVEHHVMPTMDAAQALAQVRKCPALALPRQPQ